MSAYVSKKSTLKSFSEWKHPTPYGPKLGMQLSQSRFVLEGGGLRRRVPRVIYECVCFEKVNIEVIQLVEGSDSIWTKLGMQLSQRRFVLEGWGLDRRVSRIIYERVCFEKVNNEVIRRVERSDSIWTKLGMQLSQRQVVLEGWELHRRVPRVVYECVR
ncbi:unnamed protein product [Orchesella dallaii]|uniref:Uncharacterized protein n=1 Tax=Orchesella dallaii TaxID=48710 RepID=A0ABP1RGY9_9HEXA